MEKNEQLMRLVCRSAALTRRSPNETNQKGRKRGYGHILSAISGKDGISQQELADSLGIRPQSLSEALLALDELGYIERQACNEDRRKTLVFITEPGKEHSIALAKERVARADKVFGVLDDSEKDQLLSILSKLVELNINLE